MYGTHQVTNKNGQPPCHAEQLGKDPECTWVLEPWDQGLKECGGQLGLEQATPHLAAHILSALSPPSLPTATSQQRLKKGNGPFPGLLGIRAWTCWAMPGWGQEAHSPLRAFLRVLPLL